MLRVSAVTVNTDVPLTDGGGGGSYTLKCMLSV